MLPHKDGASVQCHLVETERCCKQGDTKSSKAMVPDPLRVTLCAPQRMANQRYTSPPQRAEQTALALETRPTHRGRRRIGDIQQTISRRLDLAPWHEFAPTRAPDDVGASSMSNPLARRRGE